MAKTNEIKNLETMLSESQIEEEINNILEELSANDAPEAVEDGAATEKSFDANEKDYFPDQTDSDDVKEVVVESEGLGKNDAPDAVKDGESDEKAMTAKEDDVMDTEKADDAKEVVVESEELAKNDAPEAVENGAPAEKSFNATENDYFPDQTDSDDVKEVVVESEDLELQEDLIEYYAAMSSLTENAYNNITKSYNSTDRALHNMAYDLVESIMAEAELYMYLENPSLLDESAKVLNEGPLQAYKQWKTKKIFTRLNNNAADEYNDKLEQNKDHKSKSIAAASKLSSNKYSAEKEDWSKRMAQMSIAHKKALDNNSTDNTENYKDDIKKQREANRAFRAENNANIKRLKSEAKKATNAVDYNNKMNEINKLKEQNKDHKNGFFNSYAKKQVQDQYAKNVADANKRFADQKARMRNEVTSNKNFQKGQELNKELRTKVEDNYKQANKEAKQAYNDNINKNEKYLKDNGIKITKESALFDKIGHALCEDYEMTDDLLYTLYEDYEDAVNEDFVDDNPETSDAEDSGFGDGEAPEVTDIYTDPTLSDNDTNIDPVEDAAEVDDVVSESFKAVFNILNSINEELARNDAPEAVKEANPDEKSFSATEDDYLPNEEDVDDVDEVMIESLFNNCNGDIHSFCENVLMLYGIENPTSDNINELMEAYNEYNIESLNEKKSVLQKGQKKPSLLTRIGRKAKTIATGALILGAAAGAGATPIKANKAGNDAYTNTTTALQQDEDYQTTRNKEQESNAVLNNATEKYNSSKAKYDEVSNMDGATADNEIVKRAAAQADEDAKALETADENHKKDKAELDKKDAANNEVANRSKNNANKAARDGKHYGENITSHAVSGALAGYAAAKAAKEIGKKIDKKRGVKTESYDSLEDAIKLGYNYFVEDANRYKLIEQVALSIANENSDRLFKELVESTALANRLETAIIAKYANTAAARVANLMEDMKTDQKDEECDDEYKLGHIGIDIETGEEDECCKEKCNEELETNDAPEAVEDSAPAEKSFNATENDYFPDQTDSDDVKEVVVESEELAKNDAPEAVSDAAPVEKSFSATEDDYFDVEEADDVDDGIVIESATDDDIRAFLESSEYEPSTANISTIRRAINENVIGDIYDGVIQEGLIKYLRHKHNENKVERLNIKLKQLEAAKQTESDPVKLDKINAKIEALKSKLNIAIAKTGIVVNESEELAKNDAPEAVSDGVAAEKSFNATENDYFPDQTDSDDVKEVVVEACKTKRVAKTPSEQNKRGI